MSIYTLVFWGSNKVKYLETLFNNLQTGATQQSPIKLLRTLFDILISETGTLAMNPTICFLLLLTVSIGPKDVFSFSQCKKIILTP